MDKIIINPTATSQWSSLIAEASDINQQKLSEELESYLVFLLIRFTECPEIAEKIVAPALLESIHQPKSQQQQSLRDVGDTCLIFAGLFPGKAQRRRLHISYYVKIGQTAYHALAVTLQQHHGHTAKLFHALSEHFITLMDTMHAMHEVNGNQLFLDPLQAVELWYDTRSKHAVGTLQTFTNGMPMPQGAWYGLRH